MNKQETKIYQEALEAKKNQLRGEIDLGKLAIAETKKRIAIGTETKETLARLLQTQSYTLKELALLLNRDP